MEIRFKQIFVQRDLLYGLAEDGSIWMCRIRTSTDNGIGLNLGEILEEWRKIKSPEEDKPKAQPGFRSL